MKRVIAWILLAPVMLYVLVMLMLFGFGFLGFLSAWYAIQYLDSLFS